MKPPVVDEKSARVPGRLPPGRRGLKLGSGRRNRINERSPSPRKAWIETPSGGAPRADRNWSPSPRKAWIETISVWLQVILILVAFPPEGVD